MLAEKLALGGAVTFASAAAIALGVAAVPVYEVYKVGDDPHWLEGLDLLGPLGLDVALIPHYDNAEGGTHDTRFAYLGEERLARLEADLPAGTFVLGVDEHTGVVLDLDAQTAEVLGRGGVTVRAAGRSARIEAGEVVALATISEMAEDLGSGPDGRPPPMHAVSGRCHPLGSALSSGRRTWRGGAGGAETAMPLLEAIRAYEAAFAAARQRGDVAAMVAPWSPSEDELWSWRADTLQSDEFDRGARQRPRHGR